jgi:hypothetical protein
VEGEHLAGGHGVEIVHDAVGPSAVSPKDFGVDEGGRSELSTEGHDAADGAAAFDARVGDGHFEAWNSSRRHLTLRDGNVPRTAVLRTGSPINLNMEPPSVELGINPAPCLHGPGAVGFSGSSKPKPDSQDRQGWDEGSRHCW